MPLVMSSLADSICGRQKWIFAESVRRTIVIAQSFIALYEEMNGSREDGSVCFSCILLAC